MSKEKRTGLKTNGLCFVLIFVCAVVGFFAVRVSPLCTMVFWGGGLAVLIWGVHTAPKEKDLWPNHSNESTLN